MKKIVFVFTGLLFAAGPVLAQKNKKANTPDEQITVNKKYDDQGNLIQFDSTYVHTWSSDSTMQFSFPDNDFFSGNGFPDMGKFLQNFMNDSTAHFQHGFNPFGDDDFFNHFNGSFPDSMMQNFSFHRDSMFFDFPIDSLRNHMPPDFRPNFDELMQGLGTRPGTAPNPFFDMPSGTQTPEQQKEWQQLMEKHRQEIENIKKKWEEQNNNNQ